METGELPARYGMPAIVLHWLTALLIVCGFTLGLTMVGLPFSRQKLQWYAWHKWIGITIWLLTCARLAWRLGHPAPTLPPMPAWQRRASGVSHVLLYGLLLCIPVSGWLYSSATGVQVVYLGLVPLPDLVPRDRALGRTLRTVHETLNFTLLAVVCLHIAAALKHHYIDRDKVLSRMLPARMGKTTTKG
jgi:cytochrome b561